MIQSMCVSHQQCVTRKTLFVTCDETVFLLLRHHPHFFSLSSLLFALTPMHAPVTGHQEQFVTLVLLLCREVRGGYRVPTFLETKAFCILNSTCFLKARACRWSPLCLCDGQFRIRARRHCCRLSSHTHTHTHTLNAEIQISKVELVEFMHLSIRDRTANELQRNEVEQSYK